MPKLISPYDLFGRESLIFWRGQIAKGVIPTRTEIADILEHNADRPLPPWFIALVADALRGALKQKRSPKQGALLDRIRLSLAQYFYQRHLAWLQQRYRNHDLAGWSCIRHADWWQGPPHERAARMTQKRFYPMRDWRTVLNLMSS
jgi:hypothetical protein